MKKVSKRSLCILLSITIIFSSAYVGLGEIDFSGFFAVKAQAASSGTCGDDLTWTLDDEGTLTISGTGDMTKYTPASPSPFTDWNDIKKVIIGDYITSIGTIAFSGCTNLSSVIIGDDVTKIYNSAFSGCTSLTSVTFPESLTSIMGNVFSGCTSLTSVTIPKNVTSISSGVFSGCISLASINVDENNTAYTSIDGVLFDNTATTLISYPEGKINTEYTVPDSVTSINYDAFSSCVNLKSVVISDSVTSIGNDAFSDCTNLVSVTMGNSVTTIGSSAFSGCTALVSITIPDSVTSMGTSIFNGCTNLSSATIGNNVTSVGNSTFSDCTNLTSVAMGNSVTSIGNYAFRNCLSLTSITIPDRVSSIGNSAFYNCTSLISIVIPSNVTSIATRAFYDCYPSYVFFAGSEDDWANITVSTGNDGLTNADIHYNATDHTYSTEWTADVLPTCTGDGSKSHHCTVCGYKVDVTVIASLGHDYSTEWTIDTEATCTEDGSKSHHCSRCDSTTDVTVIEATGHSYGDWVVGLEPNCTEVGSRSKTCSACGDVATEAIVANGHNYSDEWTIDIEPTCIEDGSKSRHCAVCDDKTDITPIEATGHSYGDWVVDTEASCAEEGSKHKTCSICGDVAAEVIVANGHNYSDEWTVDIEPTCTEEGSKSHHCLNCDEKSDITIIEATGHLYGDWVVTTEPTCTEVGSAERYCDVCGCVQDYFSFATLDSSLYPVLDGDYQETEVEGYTCRTYYFNFPGAESLILDFASVKLSHLSSSINVHDENGGEPICFCNNFGGTLSSSKPLIVYGSSFIITLVTPSGNSFPTFAFDSIAIGHESVNYIGHDYSTEWIIDVEATCSEDGSKSYHCTRCDSKSDVTAIPAIGHDYGDWVVTSEPDCIEEGSRYKTCSVCDDVVKETIAPNGHNYSEEWTIDVDATCAEDGSKSRHCTVCDDKTDITPIEATGHSYGDWIVDLEPNCIDDGLKHKTCSICGDIITETIVANGHNYSEEWTIDVDATCAEDGSKSRHCTVCDDKTDITTIAATNEHSYGDWVVTVEPSCEEYGEAVRTCSVCGINESSIGYEEELDIIAPLGHSYSDDWVIGYEPTCIEDGVRYRICDICGYENEENISRTGHSYGEWVTIETNCLEDNYAQRSCSQCNATQTRYKDGKIILDSSDIYSWHETVGVYMVEASCSEASYIEVTFGEITGAQDKFVYSDTSGIIYDSASNFSYSTVRFEGDCIQFGVATLFGADYCIEIESVVAYTEQDDSLGATGHNYVLQTRNDDHPHTIEYKCSYCAETKTETPSVSNCIACNFEYTAIDSSSYKLISYIGTGNDVEIPSTYNNRAVTTISNGCFKGNTSIVSVKISDGITSIGSLAFMNCTSLEKVYIPTSVTSIGTQAFYGFTGTIYCAKDSFAHEYAVANNIDYVLLSIIETEKTRIDYDNFVVYTSVQNCNDILEILDIPDSAVAIPLASYIYGNNELYGTGTIITVFDGDDYIGDYTLIVEGDLNGDSVCNILDVFDAERASNGHIELEGACAMAADSNSDDIIDINDYQSIVNKALAS